jgi:hypothetical protein
VVAEDPDDRKGRLKDLGGSQSDRWNNVLANQAMQALWVKNSSPDEHADRREFAALLRDMKRRVEQVEGDE